MYRKTVRTRLRYQNPILRYFMILSILTVSSLQASSQSNEEWTVLASPESLNEEAVKVALNDLKEAGKDYGVIFHTGLESNDNPVNTIVLGNPARNKQTQKIIERAQITLEDLESVESFEIITLPRGGGKTVVVSGGSVLADAYGLYWVRDRLRVHKSMTSINVKREPKLQVRYTRTPVSNKEDIRRALRYGLNLVFVRDVLNFVPWDAEPEKSENAKSRARAKELIDYAHALHMKCAAFGTDFTYHPSLLDEFGAVLSPSDPNFWKAVKAKYRRLLKAVPELDGVATFTGPEQHYWGNYKTFDPMHDGENCDWSLAKRYRTYIQNVLSVVSGEFNKILMHRTWTTTSFEQQSQPEVYRDIFTDEVPVKNLYLIPSFTQNDRWWHQRYNPTLNQTPHNMMVVFESMDYHAGGNLFPTFPGPYFQAGLQLMLDGDNSNLKGCSLDLPGGDGWDTRNLTAYTVARLSWDHHEDVRSIAEDFASIYFGPAAAPVMGGIFMQSPTAYKYGLYIEPVAYGEFNSLPHIRVGMFVADGYPRIDNGKVHLDFLRKIYLRCKPWIPETLQDLDRGLETAAAMSRSFQRIKSTIDDSLLAGQVENSLELTRLLIRTNNLYVRTCFAFFGYREKPSMDNKMRLKQLCDELEKTCSTFSGTPGFGYQLFGVKQLIANCRQVLNDREEAEERFASAPGPVTIERCIKEEQEKYSQLLDAYAGETIHLGHWLCKVDGRDLIRIQGSKIETEHLRWDGMTVAESVIINPLPAAGPVSVIPRPVSTRPLHPFILEQPSGENGCTVTVYLNDVEGGGDWWEFDLFYILKSPQELGLNTAWRVGTPNTMNTR